MDLKDNLLFIAFLSICQEVFCQVDCELRKSSDSIFVYACKVSDSNLKSIKANFNIKTTPEVLASNLMDVSNYPLWQYHSIGATILKKISDNEVIYHSEIEAPWPVSNRDLIMHLKITKDSLTKVMIIDVNSMPEYIPEKEDVVRVPDAHAHWKIVPLSKSEVQVNYFLLIDPGGTIPAWLLNLSIAEGPYETFRNLKSRIRKVGR